MIDYFGRTVSQELLKNNVNMNESEPQPNPKKMFTDWVASILLAAQNGRACLKHGDKTSKEDIDNASDYFGEIIGQCRAMNSVMKNVR